MKHKFVTIPLAFITTLGLCLSTGCGGLFGGDNRNDTPKEYTIQYSDDAGAHTFTVTEGMPYSLESVPYKYGYEFLGLYDAQTGGTQYVGANGASLSPYTDKENKVLFPQFKPIDYTVILDYGNATVTGERSLTVAYNAALPELPKNLALAHNEFTGWYTEAGGKGTQVADAYGNIPVVSVLNEEYFKLDESKRVYLYAGFELEKYTVTFIFDNGIPSEEVEVPYNTPISQVVPKTRNSEKKAGLTWSKSKNGEVFNGNITDDIVLYVKDWAPVIELNGNGADITPIVARAGSTISLPTPTKPLAKFLRWEDENGEAQDLATMPPESMTLNAVWQAKIELDENGGTDVDDISKPAGENLSLPTPTKEDYLFAGWYTADKERYTQTKMPSAGIALKAGWYKEKSETKTILNDSEQLDNGQADVNHGCYMIQVGNFSSALTVRLEVSVSLGIDYTEKVTDAFCEIYTERSTSSRYYVKKETFEGVCNTYRTYTFEISAEIEGSLYLMFYHNKIKAWAGFVQKETTLFIDDFYYTIYYPDTTYLYL